MSANETTLSQEIDNNALAAKHPAKRRRSLLWVTCVFILAGLAWLLLWWLVFSIRESTDNAYVTGNQVAISAQVSGTVVAILADNTEHVTVGQILVKLDNTDADIRLRRARAALAMAVRQVRHPSRRESVSQ